MYRFDPRHFLLLLPSDTWRLLSREARSRLDGCSNDFSGVFLVGLEGV